jgi:hypothetical protein
MKIEDITFEEKENKNQRKQYEILGGYNILQKKKLKTNKKYLKYT